ncbi:MAG: TetR/AcrR family transcriptional regulator [Sandaracinus sp.]
MAPRRTKAPGTSPTPQASSPRRVLRESQPAKRVRRTAEDARSAILDAASRRIAEVGAAGLRLQDVAREVGVSHPTILHHFGSREGLVAAVVHRAVDALHGNLLEEIAKGRKGEEPIVDMLEAAARVLGPMGHARVVAWLSLGGEVDDTRGSESVERVARAAHELRRVHRGEDTPPYEDTSFVIQLAALALFGEVVVGPMLLPREDERARARRGKRFRAWLAGVIQHHLEHGGTPTPR